MLILTRILNLVLVAGRQLKTVVTKNFGHILLFLFSFAFVKILSAEHSFNFSLIFGNVLLTIFSDSFMILLIKRAQ